MIEPTAYELDTQDENIVLTIIVGENRESILLNRENAEQLQTDLAEILS